MRLKPIGVLALGLIVSSAWGQSEPLTARQAVELAWTNRPIVQAAHAQIEEAKAHRRAATAFPATILTFGRGTDPVPGSTDSDLALIQPLDVFGRNRAAGRTADANVRVAEIGLRESQLEVQTEALTAYNELVAAEKRLVVMKGLLDLATRLHDAALRKVELGDAPEVQAIRARIELDRARQAFELRQTEVLAARQRLSGAVGGLKLGVSAEFFVAPETEGGDLLSARPDLMAFAGELQVVESRIVEQRLVTRPEVAFEARRSGWTEEVQFGVRLQVSLPLTDYGRNRNEVRALELQREAVQRRLADALVLAEAEFAATKTDVSAAAVQVQRLRELLDDARELVAITQRGFDSGALTLVETLEANRALREVEESLVEAELHLAQGQVALIRSAGQLLEAGR